MRFKLWVVLLCLLWAMPTVGDVVELIGGDMLHGRIVEQGEQTIIIDHPVLGRLTVPMEQVAFWQVSPADADADAATKQAPAPAEGGKTVGGAPAYVPPHDPAAPPAPKPVEVGLFGTGLFAGWDNALSAGFTGHEGNSQSLSFNAQFKTSYVDERDRLIWDTKYFYSTDDGEKSTNELKSEFTRDWLDPDSPWFYFVTLLYQYDQFEAWEHRAGAFTGVGYTWVNNPDFEFNTRVGAGATHEWGIVNQTTPEGLIGAAVVRWNLTDHQTLTASNTLYPSFAEPGEFRNTTSIEWNMALNQADGLSVKLGLENEYESETQGDDKHNDLKYYGAIVFDF